MAFPIKNTTPNTPGTAPESQGSQEKPYEPTQTISGMTPTTVVIGQTPFELNHISQEKASELYAALGTAKDDKGQPTKTNYQELADKVAAVVVNYQSVVSVNLPAGMSPTQAVQNLMTALKEGGGKLADGASDYMKQMMDTPFGKQIQENGLYKTADGVASVLGAIGAFGSGFGKGLMLPVTAYNALKDGSKDAVNWLDGKLNPISAEEAKSIGAVYAAAVYNAVDAPTAPEETKSKDPGFMDYIVGGGSFVWDYVSTFCSAGWKFATGGFKDWSKCWEEAGGTPKGFSEHVADRAAGKNQEKIRSSASDVLAQVEEVAGVSTKNLSTLVKNGGIYRDNDGNWNSLTFDAKGMPTSQAVDLAKDKNTSNDSDLKKCAMVGGITAGGLTTYQVGLGFTKGFTSQMVGSKSVPMQIIDKELSKANTLFEKSEVLRNGKPAGKYFWQREVGPNLVKADKVLAEAQEAVTKVDVEKVAVNNAKAVSRAETLSGTKVGEKVLELAESKPTNWLQKAGSWCGQKWGWCLEKVGLRSAESVATTFETVGVTATTRAAAKAVPLLNIVPEAADAVYSIATTGVNSRQSTKAVTSLSIVGSCTAIGCGIGTVVPVVGNIVGAGIGACVGGIISWFSAEPITDAICGPVPTPGATAAATAPAAPGSVPAPNMDAGLTAANLAAEAARTAAAQNAALRSGQSLAINGAKTTVGAVTPGAPAPIPGVQTGQTLFIT